MKGELQIESIVTEADYSFQIFVLMDLLLHWNRQEDSLPSHPCVYMHWFRQYSI